MTGLPFVSCLCPTYNRYPDFGHLVAESVECFLLQTYPADRRELIILNDTPGQVLSCSGPNIVVVNRNNRLGSLGEKRNVLTHLARGEIIFPWDDDDISLPTRLAQGVQMLTDWQQDYWIPIGYWYTHSNSQPSITTGALNRYIAGCHTLKAWAEVGGNPHTSHAEDQIMHQLLTDCPDVRKNGATPMLDYKEFAYIYRWGQSPCHLSGHRDLNLHWQEIGERPITRGYFPIRPEWRLDYPALVAAACK